MLRTGGKTASALGTPLRALPGRTVSSRDVAALDVLADQVKLSVAPKRAMKRERVTRKLTVRKADTFGELGG